MGKHVLITGRPGVGKTTLIKKVCETLKEKEQKHQGFYTEEVRSDSKRIGFDIVTVCGKQGCLARTSDSNSECGPKVGFLTERLGKYVVDISAFESLALPCFDVKDSTILVLDEIGKMELFSRQFQEAVQKAFDASDMKILATVPVRSVPFVESLKKRDDVTLVTVTQGNRDKIQERVMELLKE